MDEARSDGIHLVDTSIAMAKLWNDYVQTSQSAGFYHQFEWKLVNEVEFKHKNYYLASITRGNIDGVFPLVLLRSRLFGCMLCSLPFVNFCGPSASSSEVEVALLRHAYGLADDNGVDFLEIRSPYICDEYLPRSLHKASMTISLETDSKRIWNSYQSKHRTNIRRVYKSGVTVKHGGIEFIDTFYDIMAQSWRNLGTPLYRKSYFQSILKTFGDQIRIFVAYHGSTPVATALNGYYGDAVEGMWAATLPAYRNLQINYVLYWEMIQHACEAGFKVYNLGRSSVSSGGEAFKKKWGAQPQQLYWQYYLPNGGSVPQLNVTNPKYQLAIRTWRKLPLWTTRIIGPILAKNIP